MNKFKKTYLLNSDSWRDLINRISQDVGLPEVSSSLGIYFDTRKSNYEIKFVNSKSEAKRLIQQGGVYIDDKKTTDFELIPKKPFTLRVGRRKIIKIV